MTKTHRLVPKLSHLFGFALLLLLAACGSVAPDFDALPTLAEPDAIATGFVLTENAPPAGFETVSFPRIDDNLTALSGWRYQMRFAFEGVYARTPRTTSTITEATVAYNQVGSARRVLATIDDDLEASADPVNFEGVRLGPDVFLVRDGNCIQTSRTDATLLADLSAGALLGGVRQAQVVPRTERINGQQVWLYDFTYDDLILPNIVLAEDSRILNVTAELWVAPEHNAVVRFYATISAENVRLFDQTLPVTGDISLRYDLYDIGTQPNITIPFGC